MPTVTVRIDSVVRVVSRYGGRSMRAPTLHGDSASVCVLGATRSHGVVSVSYLARRRGTVDLASVQQHPTDAVNPILGGSIIVKGSEGGALVAHAVALELTLPTADPAVGDYPTTTILL